MGRVLLLHRILGGYNSGQLMKGEDAAFIRAARYVTHASCQNIFFKFPVSTSR